MPRIIVTVAANTTSEIEEGLTLAQDQIFYSSVGSRYLNSNGNITITSKATYTDKSIAVTWRVEDDPE